MKLKKSSSVPLSVLQTNDVRQQANDFEPINHAADELNAEAADALEYQHSDEIRFPEALDPMKPEAILLEGHHVRLEPLGLEHVDALVAASTAEHDPDLYNWSPVPQSRAEAIKYVETAVAWRDAGTAFAFATVRRSDGAVIGSTRFFDIERWPWPAGHHFHNRTTPDVCEIGYTWLTASAIRTSANTEAKLLMLTHAFESWKVHRLCFHTDMRNERSRNALARIGGKFEGILRAHRMSADFIPRDSARFSIIAAEWPEVKQMLGKMLDKG